MIEMSCWSSDRLRKQAFLNDSDTCVPWRAVKTHISLLSPPCSLCDMFVSPARSICDEFFLSFRCRWCGRQFFWSGNYFLHQLLILSDGVGLYEHGIHQNKSHIAYVFFLHWLMAVLFLQVWGRRRTLSKTDPMWTLSEPDMHKWSKKRPDPKAIQGESNLIWTDPLITEDTKCT